LCRDIVALDAALRRNEPNWFETLPDEIERPIIHKLYYGHFFCHVFHQDYIVSKGHNTMEFERRMWKLLDGRGAQYPAEHNVGHLYEAKPALVNHYRGLDFQSRYRPDHQVDALARVCVEVELTVARRKAVWSIRLGTSQMRAYRIGREAGPSGIPSTCAVVHQKRLIQRTFCPCP
jgi:hypothetical protein